MENVFDRVVARTFREHALARKNYNAIIRKDVACEKLSSEEIEQLVDALDTLKIDRTGYEADRLTLTEHAKHVAEAAKATDADAAYAAAEKLAREYNAEVAPTLQKILAERQRLAGILTTTYNAKQKCEVAKSRVTTIETSSPELFGREKSSGIYPFPAGELEERRLRADQAIAFHSEWNDLSYQDRLAEAMLLERRNELAGQYESDAIERQLISDRRTVDAWLTATLQPADAQ